MEVDPIGLKVDPGFLISKLKKLTLHLLAMVSTLNVRQLLQHIPQVWRPGSLMPAFLQALLADDGAEQAIHPYSWDKYH